MIKTSHKDKLPQGMSYPVGAEILSNALVGVPQYEDLKISFWFENSWLKKRDFRYNQKVKEQDEIMILKISHSSFSRFDFDKWRITVSSVPSTHKKQVSEQLIAHVLPELRQCLIKAGSNAETFDFKASFFLATRELKIL